MRGLGVGRVYCWHQIYLLVLLLSRCYIVYAGAVPNEATVTLCKFYADSSAVINPQISPFLSSEMSGQGPKEATSSDTADAHENSDTLSTRRSCPDCRIILVASCKLSMHACLGHCPHCCVSIDDSGRLLRIISWFLTILFGIGLNVPASSSSRYTVYVVRYRLPVDVGNCATVRSIYPRTYQSACLIQAYSLNLLDVPGY